MVFYLYDNFEKEYHHLSSSRCECKPKVEIIDETRDVLIIHNSLVDPEKQWTEDQIEEARQNIIQQFQDPNINL